MTLREIFILVLRSIGVWAGVQAISGLTAAALQVWPLLRASSGEFTDDRSLWVSVLLFGIRETVQLVVALVLVLSSARIANWFYPKPDGADSTKPVAIDPQLAYQMAARLLGVYALLWSIRPLSRIPEALLDHDRQVTLRGGEVEQVLQAGLYLGFAFVLFAGSRRIGGWLAGVRHTSR